MIRLSLGSKILVAVGVVILVVFGVSTVFYIANTRLEFKNNMYLLSEAMLAPTLNNMAMLRKTDNNDERIAKSQFVRIRQLYENNRGENVSEIMLVNDRGDIVAHNLIEDLPRRLDSTLVPYAQTKIKKTLLYKSFYYVFIPINGNNLGGGFTAIIVFNTSNIKKKESLILVQSLGLFTLLLILGLTLTYFFVVRELHNFTRALLLIIEKASHAGFNVDADTLKQDKLGLFTQTAENMHRTTQESAAQCQKPVGKNSHEEGVFHTLQAPIKADKKTFVKSSDMVLTKASAELSQVYISGIDVKKGLVVCGGNKKLFRRLLLKFFHTEKDFPKRIRCALDTSNIEAVIDNIHTFKGVSGSLGATELSELAAKIESFCRQDSSDKNIWKLLNELETKLDLQIKSFNTQLQGLPVLIVEDSEIHQEILAQQLRTLGYGFEVAGNGKEAISLIEEKDYGLAIVDLKMPKVDGFTLIQKLRQQGFNLPIIVATSDISLGDAGGCLSLGANELIEKPIELKNLSALLEKWLPLSRFEPLVVPNEGLTEASASAPIDQAMLDQYLPFDNATKLKYFKRYVESKAEDIEQLSEGLKNANWELIEHITHKLSSASRLIGALKMVEICHEISELKCSMSTAKADALIDKIQNEFTRVRKYVSTLT